MERTEILPLVIEDLRERSRIGTRKYGEPLTTFNGRNALQDAYEEAQDEVQYLRQLIEEINQGKCSAPSCAPCIACSIRLIPSDAPGNIRDSSVGPSRAY